MRSSRDVRALRPGHLTNHRATRPPLLRLLAVTGLLAAVLGSIPLAGPVAAGPADNFSLSKTDNVGGEALIGELVTYTLQATGDHASAAPLYNLSFRDVLQSGVSFVSADPAPTEVLVDVPAAGQTTVIWSNVSDLQDGVTESVSYTITHDGSLDVGDSITNSAGARRSSSTLLVLSWTMIAGGTIVCTQMRSTRTISLRTMVFAATRFSAMFTRRLPCPRRAS